MERSDGCLSDGGRPLLGNIYLVIFVYQGWFTPLPTTDPQLDITSMSMGPDTSLDHQMYMNYLVSRARCYRCSSKPLYKQIFAFSLPGPLDGQDHGRIGEPRVFFASIFVLIQRNRSMGPSSLENVRWEMNIFTSIHSTCPSPESLLNDPHLRWRQRSS